ncbi:unnamed protein product [Somion occarium]|uniref:Uncharacterized protein n=1 Tax=Somion occarium TaxID=3059160 RepID=A0ABP1CKA2_9APHY
MKPGAAYPSDLCWTAPLALIDRRHLHDDTEFGIVVVGHIVVRCLEAAVGSVLCLGVEIRYGVGDLVYSTSSKGSVVLLMCQASTHTAVTLSDGASV